MSSKPSDTSSDVALSLTSAVITTSPYPLVMLNGDLLVVAASASFCDAFCVDCAQAGGQPFHSLGRGEWASPELRALLVDAAGGGSQIKAHAIDLMVKGEPPRRVILNAHKLDYADITQVRLLLGVMDATDARAAELLTDKLHREALVLLQEVRHRAANSLQIVGSVLLLSAHRSQYEEVRVQLKNAYHRVMSLADLERQLAPSETGDVALRPYLETLCDRISGSMISDPEQISIHLALEERTVPTDLSISLGLIVTELVINALKHAFPDGRQGRITIHYEARDKGWALTVRDDGTGRQIHEKPTKGGLGATIVEALASQNNARVETSDAQPGTIVSIVFD